VASDREERASSAALIRGRPGYGQPQPSWRSSVGHLAGTSPERRRGDVALPSPRRLLAAAIGLRASRRRTVPPGLNRFVAAPRCPAQRSRWLMPGRAARRREPSLELSRRLVTICGGSYPGMGTVSDIELDSNRRNPPPTRAKSARAAAINPPISRQNVEWRGPESNRGHHDFQAVAIAASRRQKPHKHADHALASAWLVPVDAVRCVGV
jgi:hypothetical protein